MANKTKKVPCRTCDGTGKIEVIDSKGNIRYAICPYCWGTGKVDEPTK